MRTIQSFVNPLFNKKVFLLACLIVSCAALLVRQRLRTSSDGSLPAGVDGPVLKRIERLASLDPSSSYGHGYISGFNAFLAQTDQPPIQVASYTSGEGVKLDAKEVERGYVDGYHKATELQSCPRVIQQY